MMKPASMLTLVWILIAVLLPANANANTNQNANNEGNFILNLLHVNDHHSHLEEETMAIPLSTVENKARRIRYGGFPRIVKIMRNAKKTWENVLKIHAGDALVGTGFYHLFGTAPDTAMMHQVCFDVFNLGNHEFDDGDSVLADFLTKLTDVNSPCQNTRVLSANLQAGQTSPLRPLQQQGYIAPYTIRNFPGGHKVGIIGVDIRNKTLIGSQPDAGTTLLDERTAIRQQVRTLERLGINKIVLVSHLGIAKDQNWATRLEGVDVVIGAHSHTLLANKVDSVLAPKSQYPQIAVQRNSGKPICIAQAWKFGHGVGRLKVEFDANGDVTMCGGSYIVPFEPNLQASDTDAIAMTNYLEGLGPTFVKTGQDVGALQALNYYTKQMNGQTFFDQVLVKQAEPLCNEAIPGGGNSNLCKKKDTAAHGGAACQLVAQAMLDQTWEADVAIQNAGGCRADIAEGNFTYGHAMELLPYSDTLVTLNMSGWQVKTVLEQALELALGESSSSGSYPYASGLRFDVNASKEIGHRITNLQLNARLAAGTWNDIEWEANYTVVTNSFLAAGRDGYLEFQNATEHHELPVSYLDAFISYLEEQGGIISPDLADMSTQTFVGSVVDEAVTEEVLEDSNDEVASPMWTETVDTATQLKEGDSNDIVMNLPGSWSNTDEEYSNDQYHDANGSGSIPTASMQSSSLSSKGVNLWLLLFVGIGCIGSIFLGEDSLLTMQSV